MSEPFLRELPSGHFEKIYPTDWPMPPGPERPNIVRRAEALVAITQGMKAERYPVSLEDRADLAAEVLRCAVEWADGPHSTQSQETGLMRAVAAYIATPE